MGLMFQDRLNRSFVILLVVLFGLSTWITINGLWVELPLLVALGIPEGYNLASYLVIIIQLANIGPLVYSIADHFVRGNKLEAPCIYLGLFLGVVSCLLLVFFWDVTTFWEAIGEERSTALLCLAFLLALKDTTSSVTFIPFMVRLDSAYMLWFFVGQGLCSLAPSLIALGQGVSNQNCVANTTYTDELSGENCTTWMVETSPANYPPVSFFWLLFATMLVAMVAFFILHSLTLAKKEFVIKPPKVDAPENSDPEYHCRSIAGTAREYAKKHSVSSANDVSEEDAEESFEEPALEEYVLLFFLLAVVNAMRNGVLPSIQSYSCGAYGFNAYLLATTLGHVANPVGCFVVLFFPKKSLALVTSTCLVAVLAGCYCMATAALSPTPPLQHDVAGTVIVVIAWVLVSGLFAHTKSSIGWILRHEPDNHKLLRWYGIVTQVGSLAGAVVMFPLVNVLHLFTAYDNDPCEGYPTCQ
ncbi:solute carrier family 52, riboflavin transporter, member 3-A-like [Diadema setosum]|uniref:solute carrier family 52, riboflavin transporter, member 3-A-like n=1 Tax=Diadema setosum TaxID=31175 RepID=UPI003B3B4EFD